MGYGNKLERRNPPLQIGFSNFMCGCNYFMCVRNGIFSSFPFNKRKQLFMIVKS